MKTILGLAAAAGLLVAAGKSGPDVRAARVARGKYLVTIGSCNECHTPWKFNAEFQTPEQDWSRMLSGHPDGGPDPASDYKGHDMAIIGPDFTSFRFPFGVTYSANLTPDKQTGLGNWTEEMFVGALRKGKHMGGDGRVIMPPMPWPMIGQMTDEDLKSVFAYLQSIPAIKNEVPPHRVPDAVIEQMSVNTARYVAHLKAQAQR